MEINYLVDLNILKSAPQLSKSQTKKLLKELEHYIFNADWITIGIMASHDYSAVDALKSISKKYSSIKFRGLDSLHADGSVFLKGNQKTGNVFIRSVAARGHLGGLSIAIPSIIDVVDAAGWPIIILETVGTGQSETEIMELADIKVVVNAPGLGDDIQAIKAGVLEIGDILVVNKCDQPLSDSLVQQLKSMLELRSSEKKNIPIIATSATEDIGIQELDKTIKNISLNLGNEYKAIRQANRLKGNLWRKTEQLFRSRLKEINSKKIEDILHQLRNGIISNGDAAEMILNLCVDKE